MSDNRPTERQAETFVEHQLLKYNIKVSKPSFDQEGADLLVIDQIKKQTTSFLKIQCKFRSYSREKPNIVSIPARYVTDNFILFLYIIDDNKDDALYVYFCEDLRRWTLSKGEYYLNISIGTVANHTNYVFDAAKSELIKQRLRDIDLKKYTTLIIDGIFLEKAIQNTREIYGEIWPEKVLTKPTLNEIILNLLTYNRFPASKSDIQVVLFSSDDFNLERWLTFSDSSVKDERLENIRLTIHKSNRIVAVEILEYLERIVNTENVLLVADDILYEQPLNELEESGVDVILIRLKGDFGGKLLTKHRWGDINYPLALAMGLKPYEL